MTLIDEKEKLHECIVSWKGDITKEVANFLKGDEGGFLAYFKKSKNRNERWNCLADILDELLEDVIPEEKQEFIIKGILNADRTRELVEYSISTIQVQSHRTFQYNIKKCVLDEGLSKPFMEYLVKEASKSKGVPRYEHISYFGGFTASYSDEKTWKGLYDLLEKEKVHNSVIFHFQRESLIGAVQGNNLPVIDFVLANLIGEEERLFQAAVETAAKGKHAVVMTHLMQKEQFNDNHLKSAIICSADIQNQTVMDAIIQIKGCQPVQDLLASSPQLFSETAAVFVKSIIDKKSLMEKHGRGAAKASIKGL